MSALSDDPVHQYSAEDQKHRTCTHKSGGNEEIVSSSDLEPCRFRKRDVSCQKHQREQRRDNHIKYLPDGFCQALRRLRYQAFWEFHSVAHKSAAKIRKLVKLPNPSKPPKPTSPQILFAWRKQQVCVFSRNRNRLLWFLLLFSESQ